MSMKIYHKNTWRRMIYSATAVALQYPLKDVCHLQGLSCLQR